MLPRQERPAQTRRKAASRAVMPDVERLRGAAIIFRSLLDSLFPGPYCISLSSWFTSDGLLA